MPLPPIPLIALEAGTPADLLAAERARAEALVSAATRFMPRPALKAADRLSRHWLARAETPYLDEIARVAEQLGRPGGWFLNACYEWGCTSAVGAAPDGRGSRLLRVLDWRLAGLGVNLVAARRRGPAGGWIDLTWPGFAGVIQATAPGRFAAAFNQAPMTRLGGGFLLDWALARHGLWQRPALPPAHLLRRVFDQAPDYAAARRQLIETPVALPAIYLICGAEPGQACVIERRPEEAKVIEGPAAAANHWQAFTGAHRPRGAESERRQACLMASQASTPSDLGWLAPPVLNKTTRLAMVAEPANGHLLVQGFECDGPATAPLVLENARQAAC